MSSVKRAAGMVSDGSLRYAEGTHRAGMIFHPYDRDGIVSLLSAAMPYRSSPLRVISTADGEMSKLVTWKPLEANARLYAP